MDTDALKAVDGGLTLAVRLTPKAAAERIDGWISDDAGNMRLKVAVTVVPENGKANAALIKFLAKKLKLPKTAVRLIGGDISRQKLLFLEGPADADGLAAFQEEITARLAELAP